jgi:hypothetical protein
LSKVYSLLLPNLVAAVVFFQFSGDLAGVWAM